MSSLPLDERNDAPWESECDGDRAATALERLVNQTSDVMLAGAMEEELSEDDMHGRMAAVLVEFENSVTRSEMAEMILMLTHSLAVAKTKNAILTTVVELSKI